MNSESDDFITSLAFSPQKYFAHGLLNGLVVVEFLSSSVCGLTCRRVPYDGTTVEKDLRFRVGKNTNNIQHTVTGCVCREWFTIGSASTIRLNTSLHMRGTAHSFYGTVSIEVVCRTLRNRVIRCVVRCRYSTSIHGITACCNSYDGSILVYAKGYAWDLVVIAVVC